MRDYANPVLLLVITALFAWAMSAAPDSESVWLQPGVWLLTVCATGCMVNALLALARGLAHRPVMAGMVWSMVYLVLGSCAWVYLSQDDGVNREDLAKYRTLIAQKDLSPYAADDEGDTLLSLAAGLGKDSVVRRLLANNPHGAAEQRALIHAAWYAAQHGRDKALLRLLEAGVSPDADYADGTLLTTAVNSGKKKVVLVLLERGAQVNRTDAAGNTPFLHAVLNRDVVTARLLRERGADPDIPNREGRRAADYSVSDKTDALIQQTPPKE